ncbi:RimJ/RimL family protein N-acetyltransferase [Microvirgula sp. AG722]|uniref:GNAT family N-acetyltransferase n=1 Tax=Microvirgula sp. AG722 TaxID=2183901 RepID=UPI000DC1FE59|nr:GNAT family N-acetyltransferase [Microvirgula sp. AG722]RAS15755.1 RimJ/RimL family protein N-acetyltransferase [Microvirgula sp. AG722]
MSAFSLCLPDQRLAASTIQDSLVTLQVGSVTMATLQLSRPAANSILLTGPLHPETPPLALMPLLAELFCHQPSLRDVMLDTGCTDEFAVTLVRMGIMGRRIATANGWRLGCSRAVFWQQPQLWLPTPGVSGVATEYVMSHGRRHPRRAPQPQGVVYQRYLPRQGCTFTLRVANIRRDLPLFHAWMNMDRVHRFWTLAGKREAHAAYLQAQIDDVGVLPLMGEFDGEPFAYFEVYWAKEDRLAPFYAAQDFDRGCHLLVGNSRHASKGKTIAWMRAVSHYVFLDDSRTQRLVGEPHIDNVRFISHLQNQGFAKLKEFDFPHKRAALLMLEREVFFEQHGPWGEE